MAAPAISRVTEEHTSIRDPILSLKPNIIVRRHRLSDADRMSKHANNRKIWLVMGDQFPHPYLEADAINWVEINQKTENHVASGPFDTTIDAGTGPLMPTSYAICLDDQVIGAVGINPLEAIHRRTAQWGYWLGEEYWGQGIMSKVGPAFAKWVFETFGRFMHLEGIVYEGNPASCRILEKSGMEFAYLKKKAIWKDGKMLDSHIYQMYR